MPKSELSFLELSALPAQQPCQTESLMPWLVKARAEIGELKGYTSVFSKTPDLLYSIYLLDAVDTIALDGTIFTKELALENQLLNEPEQSMEIKQMMRLRNALHWSKVELLRSNEISERFMKNVHSIITGKKTDAFRDKNVVSGKNNASIQQSRLPEAKQIKILFDDLLQFIQKDDPGFDPLVRSIIAAGQFEALRPFEDTGNRTARIFFYLLLLKSGLLKEPLLLLSSHLRKNSEGYNRIFEEAIHSGNWCPYVKFMLHGISLQAKETREKLTTVEELHHQWQHDVKKKCAQIYSTELVDTLFQLPVISPLRLSSRLNIHYTTATRYLKKLEQNKFLENKSSGKYQLYTNKQVIQLIAS